MLPIGLSRRIRIYGIIALIYQRIPSFPKSFNATIVDTESSHFGHGQSGVSQRLESFSPRRESQLQSMFLQKISASGFYSRFAVTSLFQILLRK